MAAVMDEGLVARWRWELYTLCTMDALTIPLIGEALEGRSKEVASVISYLVWISLLALFGATFYERASNFMIRCLYYLLCSAFPLAFFGSFPNTALHLWLPISCCLGIFVGVALRECYSQTTRRAGDSIHRMLLEWQHAREPTLPVHHLPMDLRLDVHTGARALQQEYTVYDAGTTLNGSQSSPNMVDSQSTCPKVDN